MQKYRIEVTDTFSGEANYSWVRRYVITAKSELGAAQKMSKIEGLHFRSDGFRYNAQGACICAFIDMADDHN